MGFLPASYEHCLITGASSGIGRRFAEVLASRSRRLTLVARRRDRLESLARTLTREHEVTCAVIEVDLAVPEGPAVLIRELKLGQAPPVHLLVNNAGFGRHGEFRDFPWEDYQRMFQLNMITPAALLHALWDDLTGGPGRGAIQVASAAGFQPIPSFAAYAASKAFLRSFSNGLALEARGLGTRVLSFCPGPVPTEFGQVAGSRWRSSKIKQRVETVVDVALAAYERGKLEVVPGWFNRLLAVVGSRVPLAWAVKGAQIMARPRS